MNLFSNWSEKKRREKAAAEASAERLDAKIAETRKATKRVVEQAHKEISAAQRVLEVAEAALRNIRNTEQRQ